MNKDISNNVKFSINYKNIERNCLRYLMYMVDEYLVEEKVDLYDLYVEDLFTIFGNFLYDFVNNEISFLTPFYYKGKEVWDIPMIIMAYLYLSKEISEYYFEEDDHIDIFRREDHIKDMIELLVAVVKKLFEIYFVKVLGIVHTAVSRFTKEKINEVRKVKEEDWIEILDLAADAGMNFEELRRWFYYFDAEDVKNYLNMGYSLYQVLDKLDMEEGEEDEEDEESS